MWGDSLIAEELDVPIGIWQKYTSKEDIGVAEDLLEIYRQVYFQYGIYVFMLINNM